MLHTSKIKSAILPTLIFSLLVGTSSTVMGMNNPTVNDDEGVFIIRLRNPVAAVVVQANNDQQNNVAVPVQPADVQAEPVEADNKAVIPVDLNVQLVDVQEVQFEGNNAGTQAEVVAIEQATLVEEEKIRLPSARDFITLRGPKKRAVDNVIDFQEDGIKVTTTHSTGEYQLMSNDVVLDRDTELHVTYKVDLEEGGFSVGILKNRDRNEAWTVQKAHVIPGQAEGSLILAKKDFKKFGIDPAQPNNSKFSVVFSNCRKTEGRSTFTIRELFWEKK